MKYTRAIKNLWSNTEGIILPYVTVMLVVIVGFVTLALDGARYFSLQTQLQNGADQLALAAAAELDGAPTAVTRADNALTTTLASFPTATLFGTGANQNVTIASHRYLSDLPDDNTSPIPTSFEVPNTTAGAMQARFVEVTVTPVTMPTIFPAAFFGGTNSVTAVATAVAGFTQNVCKFTPMYVCNPYEPVGNTDYDLATQLLFSHDVANPDALEHRQMIRLRYDPGGSIAPGNYGFLDSPLTNGFNAIRNSIARVNPEACFSRSGVTTQTGFGAQGIAQGFNVRFDIYDGSMNGNKTDPNYAPALNVRKGYTYTGTNACNADVAADPAQAMALPVDNPPGNPIGSGTWDFDTYWSVEHPGVARPIVNGNQWGNAQYLPSRYSVYLYEVSKGKTPVPPPNNGGLLDRSPGNSSSIKGEVGAPECSSQVPPSSVDRRIIFNAFINCEALTAAGVMGGGKNTNIPVAAFGKFFLIHAVDKGPATDAHIDAEFVGLTKPGDGVTFDNVQLYR